MEKNKNKVQRVFYSLVTGLGGVGSAIGFLTCALLFCDIIMRYFFNNPTRNVYELVQLSMVFVVSFTVGMAEINESHISMDLLTSKMKSKSLYVTNNVTDIMNLVIYAAVIVCSVIYSRRSYASGANIAGLIWPIWLLNVAIIAGLSIYWILTLTKLIQCARDKSIGDRGKLWAIILVILVLTGALSYVWASPDLLNISAQTVGVVSVVVMFALMLSGMPVASVLFFISLLSMIHLKGVDASLYSMGSQVFSNLNSYSWTIICFFIMMGNFVACSDFGSDIYNTAYKWFAHIKGGLAIATVAASAMMAACVGDQMSSTVTMTRVAMPEMKKYHYSDKLNIGSILGGATLGPLIPPSTGFIMYGLLTSTSIGDLFIAGIIPGILLALIFIVYIMIECRRHPEAGPAGPKFPASEKISSLKAGGPILILFVVIIGGIYGGIFTPTEGGAIGAFLSFLLALVMRRMTWQKFKKALYDTGNLVGALMILVVAAMIFGTLMIWSKLPFLLQDVLVGLNISTFGIVAFMLIVTFIMGFFMDSMVIMMITVPIFYPILQSLGVDLIWFGILTCMVQGFGALTPPFGVLLFALKGMHKEIPFETIARSVVPYVGASILLVVLIMIFPGIATWLPNAIK